MHTWVDYMPGDGVEGKRRRGGGGGVGEAGKVQKKRKGAGREGRAFVAPAPGQPRKRTEEGFRIFHESELRLGGGGGTPLCPFDCDCCF